MKVLACGSRSWCDGKAIKDRLSLLPIGSTIISGSARGADTIASAVARDLGLKVEEFPAQWEKFGKSAGFRRNLVMLGQKPDLVIAFHQMKSPGTAHTIEEARRRGIPVEVITGRSGV